jgi:hypothetical protein
MLETRAEWVLGRFTSGRSKKLSWMNPKKGQSFPYSWNSWRSPNPITRGRWIRNPLKSCFCTSDSPPILWNRLLWTGRIWNGQSWSSSFTLSTKIVTAWSHPTTSLRPFAALTARPSWGPKVGTFTDNLANHASTLLKRGLLRMTVSKDNKQALNPWTFWLA